MWTGAPLSVCICLSLCESLYCCDVISRAWLNCTVEMWWRHPVNSLKQFLYVVHSVFFVSWTRSYSLTLADDVISVPATHLLVCVHAYMLYYCNMVRWDLPYLSVLMTNHPPSAPSFSYAVIRPVTVLPVKWPRHMSSATFSLISC